MSDFTHRVLDSLLNSPLLPVTFRSRCMRAFGYKVRKDTAVWNGACFMSKRFSVGEAVFFNVGFFYDGHDELRIGDRVRFGQYVRVITATHPIGPPDERCNFDVLAGPVEVKDGAWIGSGVTILPGVTIERGCVVAAGSVVTEPTVADGLYAGNPARLVRMLP